MSCAKMAEPVEMSFEMWTRVSRVTILLDGDLDPTTDLLNIL